MLVRFSFHSCLVGLASQLAYYHLLQWARSSDGATIHVIWEYGPLLLFFSRADI